MKIRPAALLAVSLFACVSLSATDADYVRTRRPTLLAAQKRYGYSFGDAFVLISVARQKLYLIQNEQIVKSYDVSTAAKGEGNRFGSEKTPLGFHRVAIKSGGGAPIGAVFAGYGVTDRVAPIYTDTRRAAADLMLTRLLVLDGLDDLRNRGGDIDSFSRFIIIHGTQEEGRIGTKASHGCIRMRNRDIVELFALVPERTIVYLGY